MIHIIVLLFNFITTAMVYDYGTWLPVHMLARYFNIEYESTKEETRFEKVVAILSNGMMMIVIIHELTDYFESFFVGHLTSFFFALVCAIIIRYIFTHIRHSIETRVEKKYRKKVLSRERKFTASCMFFFFVSDQMIRTGIQPNISYILCMIFIFIFLIADSLNRSLKFK